MKKALFVVSVLSLMTSIVVAADGRSLRSVSPSLLSNGLFGQTPVLSSSPTPIASSPTLSSPTPIASSPTLLTPTPEVYVPISQPVELFPDVRYRATRNIACCAVPMIIQVADPCSKCSCCKTCVNVQVCVPPCEPACVKVTRDGHMVRYDFGKYAVTARTVGDHIVVRYED